MDVFEREMDGVPEAVRTGVMDRLSGSDVVGLESFITAMEDIRDFF
jgi:hypothetical protein